MILPFVAFSTLFVIRAMRGRQEVPSDEVYVLAVGIFLVATIIGISYGRTMGGNAQRYFHMLSVVPFCGFLSCCFLWRYTRPLAFRVIPRLLLLFWVGMTSYGVLSLCNAVGSFGSPAKPAYSDAQLLAQQVTMGLSQIRRYQITDRYDGFSPDAWNCDTDGTFIRNTAGLIADTRRRRFMPTDAIVPSFPPPELSNGGFHTDRLGLHDTSPYSEEYVAHSRHAGQRTSVFVSKPFLTESRLLQVPVLEAEDRSTHLHAKPLRSLPNEFRTYEFKLPQTKIVRLRFTPVETAADVIITSMDIRGRGGLLFSADFSDPQQVSPGPGIESSTRRREGCAVFRCSGGSPWFEFPTFPGLDLSGEEDVRCSVRMWSSTDSAAGLHWDAGSGWREEQSQHQGVTGAGYGTKRLDEVSVGIISESLANEDFRTYIFDLPKEKITRVRLVPVECTADVMIKSFQICAGDKILFELNRSDYREMALDNSVEWLPSFRDTYAMRCRRDGLFAGRTSSIDIPRFVGWDFTSEENARCSVVMWSSSASKARLYWDTGTGWMEGQFSEQEVFAPLQRYARPDAPYGYELTGCNMVDVRHDYASKKVSDTWTCYAAPVPGEVCRLLIVDKEEDGWVACAAPRDYPRCLLLVERVVGLNWVFLAAGLALLTMYVSWQNRRILLQFLIE